MKARLLTTSVGLGYCITIGTGCGSRVDSAQGTGGSTLAGYTTGGAEAIGGASTEYPQGGTRVSNSTGGMSSTAIHSGGAFSASGGAGTSIRSGGASGITGGASGTSGFSGGSGAGGSGIGGVSNAAGGSQGAGGHPSTATGGDGGVGGSNSTKTGTIATGGNGVAQTTDCSIFVKEASYSSKIGTVGIVSWSTTLANVDKAQIDFGVDTTYGLTAPVDLAQTDYRTLLLGMKQNHEPYHFRITVWSGNTRCTGADQVFASRTSFRPSSLKAPRVTTHNAAALCDGFLVTEGYRLNSSAGDHAFILDKDGDVVWWYQPSGFGSLSVAKMTYDGNAMWLAGDNVISGTAHVGRVSMDGLMFEDMSSQFQGFHHDLTVLPDGTVVFIAYGEDNCDEIKKLTPDGHIATIVNACRAFGNASSSRCNAVRYDPNDGTVIFSEDTHSSLVKTDLQGNIQWVLNGGEHNSFDRLGTGATGWTGNHGFHVSGKDKILFFNNGVTRDTAGASDAGRASARELTLDTTKWTTAELWSYNPSITSPTFGDVQRLENGNTLVVFSVAAIVHELDASNNLVQSLEWAGLSNAGVGYATKRKTLYGPPPR